MVKAKYLGSEGMPETSLKEASLEAVALDEAALKTDKRSYRLTNIDMLRGLVLIIMAIDHVKDFFFVSHIQDPMGDPDVALSVYLTRWVTHFCASVFVFLAGTSIGLMALRKTKNELGKFLLKRGLWLILVEIIIISTAWGFSPLGVAALGGKMVIFLQVIYVIGASMVILAALQYLGPKICLILGVVILLSHNMLDNLWPSGELIRGLDPIWIGLFGQGSFLVGPFSFTYMYPLVPWVGVMLLGYGSSFIFQKPAQECNRFLIKTGGLMIIAFIIIRALGFYGDPNEWIMQDAGFMATARDFMNVSKYPPSLLFLLITLGPMAIVCGLADRAKGWLKDTLVMFGRVPFLFYVAHIYLIHFLSVLLGMAQGFEASQLMTEFFLYPEGYGVSLIGVYGVWILVIALLYPLCKWMAGVKARRKDWWLSYL